MVTALNNNKVSTYLDIAQKNNSLFETPNTSTESNLASATKIEAKNLNDVILFGDSHAGGIKGM